MEVYAIIKDYPNYAISNFGKVINIKKNGKEIKQIKNTKGYLCVNLKSNDNINLVVVHRLVAKAYIDNMDENRNIVDHINNDITNNRVENLRWATSTENSRNAKLSNKNTSGIKGVNFHKHKKLWRARISVNGKREHIGNYKTIEEAKTARQNKAKEIFGEFINACEL